MYFSDAFKPNVKWYQVFSKVFRKKKHINVTINSLTNLLVIWISWHSNSQRDKNFMEAD